jgi:hypothetical protein
MMEENANKLAAKPHQSRDRASMTTVQIIGVSVAGAAVLLLIVALIVARRRRDDDDEPQGVRPEPSFLDQAPQDTFSVLGKPEHAVEDITIDPAYERALAAERTAAAARAQEVKQQPGGLGLDWGPDLSVRGLEPEPPAVPSWDEDPETTGELRPDDAEVTGELRIDAGVTAEPSAVAGPAEEPPTGEPTADAPAPPSDEAPSAPGRESDGGESDGREAAPEPAPPSGDESAGEVAPGSAAEAAAEPRSEKTRLVPLSDIIVTTSGKMVDLEDPDVRRMLTELVTFEIDQAADFRRRGQTIDAVLQLTEAEKVSRALGMTESAKRIRVMMEEIRQDA